MTRSNVKLDLAFVIEADRKSEPALEYAATIFSPKPKMEWL